MENIQLLKQYYSRYGGFWVYPDMLDYCYLVNPYFNRSKIIDEMQENFRMLVSEYPAGMAVNSQLASECWGVKPECIIPGNGGRCRFHQDIYRQGRGQCYSDGRLRDV